jgi:hypothetical protein
VLMISIAPEGCSRFRFRFPRCNPPWRPVPLLSASQPRRHTRRHCPSGSVHAVPQGVTTASRCDETCPAKRASLDQDAARKSAPIPPIDLALTSAA